MSAATDQIHQLKRMGFTNDEIAVDLRYDKDLVEEVSPEKPSSRQAVDRLEDIGDRAIGVLEELMTYGENERVRESAAKFLAGLQYDKEKTKSTMTFTDLNDRMVRAQVALGAQEPKSLPHAVPC